MSSDITNVEQRRNCHPRHACASKDKAACRRYARLVAWGFNPRKKIKKAIDLGPEKYWEWNHYAEDGGEKFLEFLNNTGLQKYRPRAWLEVEIL